VTDSDANIIRNKISQSNFKCLSCSKSDFQIKETSVLSWDLPSDKKLSAWNTGAKSIGCIAIICQACGHIRHHSLDILKTGD
jgi:hypothetical protein